MSATLEAAQALATVPYFAGLDQATLEAVARSAVRRRYEPGQIVLLQGEPSAGMCIVEEGWLKVIRLSPAGREQVLRFVGAGEAFGAVGVFAGFPNPATVIPLEASTVWVVEAGVILELLDHRPGLARTILRNLAENVLQLIALVEDLSLRTVEARLARHLLEEASEGRLQRPRWATQAEMAARLGTVLDVLNRALVSLAEEGLIEVARHQIRILDAEGLEAKALSGK